jgi:hypothetical protein
MSVIGDLASGIFETEFAGDTGVISISSISGWLTHNLGLLNTYLNTAFSGTDPAFDYEEKAIFTNLYMGHYYSRQAQNVLRNIATDNNGLLEVTEGDTTIRLTNKNEISKTYRGLSNDYFNEAQKLAHNYTMYQAEPQQIVGYEVGTGNLSCY